MAATVQLGPSTGCISKLSNVGGPIDPSLAFVLSGTGLPATRVRLGALLRLDPMGLLPGFLAALSLPALLAGRSLSPPATGLVTRLLLTSPLHGAVLLPTWVRLRAVLGFDPMGLLSSGGATALLGSLPLSGALLTALVPLAPIALTRLLGVLASALLEGLPAAAPVLGSLLLLSKFLLPSLLGVLTSALLVLWTAPASLPVLLPGAWLLLSLPGTHPELLRADTWTLLSLPFVTLELLGRWVPLPPGISVAAL